MVQAAGTVSMRPRSQGWGKGKLPPPPPPRLLFLRPAPAARSPGHRPDRAPAAGGSAGPHPPPIYCRRRRNNKETCAAAARYFWALSKITPRRFSGRGRAGRGVPPGAAEVAGGSGESPAAAPAPSPRRADPGQGQNGWAAVRGKVRVLRDRPGIPREMGRGLLRAPGTRARSVWTHPCGGPHLGYNPASSQSKSSLRCATCLNTLHRRPVFPKTNLIAIYSLSLVQKTLKTEGPCYSMGLPRMDFTCKDICQQKNIRQRRPV